MLVSGTTIGGGMLGLPVSTASAGLLPSFFTYLLCWVFTASTGLLILEACLWVGKETNLISLAELTLGKAGKALTWMLYLFLFGCLTVAYIVAGGNLTSEILQNHIEEGTASLLYVLVFGSMVWMGARFIGRMNLPLMIGLGVSFFGFFYFGVDHIQQKNLEHHNWSAMWQALPIIFASFGFQGLVPTLTRYLRFDGKRTRIAILIGSAIPLFVYVVWQTLIFGIIPLEGPHGLAEALQKGQSAVIPLKYFLSNPNIVGLGRAFAFFAITTSFLGVSLALSDFLADGLRIEKSSLGKLLLCGLIFIPTLIIAMLYPSIFIKALDMAGGVGVATLLGLMPILMAWSGRYHLKMGGFRALPGGKIFLGILLVAGMIEVSTECLKVIGWL
ncbi:MAG: tyrosine transporter [Chlamydiia bacterium]|nr:tyrosine transporter [Chlamydiia bacterium]